MTSASVPIEFIPDVDIGDKPISDAVKEFTRQRNSVWMLSDITNPAQIEIDFLAHYEKTFELAQKMYQEAKGYLPDRIEEPCQTGDWSYESRWLWHSFRDVQIQHDMVAAIKNNPALKYQLAGLGYLLHGEKWENIPAWAQRALSYHIIGMEPAPMQIRI